MGFIENVGFDSWPKQGTWLDKRVRVCFDYDTSRTVLGTIVRDDTQSPGRGIIRLDDGRVVMMTECQYSPLSDGEAQSASNTPQEEQPGEPA